MIDDAAPVSRTSTHAWRFRRWQLLSVPIRARLFLVSAEILALGLTIALIFGESASPSNLVRVTVLALLALGYAEAGARVARLKRYLSPGGDKVVSNDVSVWAFAAVLTVPAGWAAVLISLLYAQILVRRSRDRTGLAYRVVFAGATVVLSAQAASATVSAVRSGNVLHGGLGDAVAVVAALLVFTLVNFGLLLTGMWLTRRPPSIRDLLPDGDSFGYEIATLILGIVTAEFLVHTVALTPLALILAAYLHRSSLVNALHRTSRTDTKTGLLNLTAWTQHAQDMLARSCRHQQTATVLFCDLDHFKLVNDMHGHIVGDQVLTAVAQCLRRELRGHDGIGRFGGEEFVAIVDALDESDAEGLAMRLRTAVGNLRFDNGVRITMSIGLAHHQPGVEPPELQALIRRADTALRMAKTDGRNCVRAG